MEKKDQKEKKINKPANSNKRKRPRSDRFVSGAGELVKDDKFDGVRY